eukprot:GHVH01007090.1.p1 GENE.GHVH01007090.1~~GHVH01007090.1.p1  ORF type:complete len:1000 (+),score=104.35 GHVH01007090.1:24-3023(+)
MVAAMISTSSDSSRRSTASSDSSRRSTASSDSSSQKTVSYFEQRSDCTEKYKHNVIFATDSSDYHRAAGNTVHRNGVKTKVPFYLHSTKFSKKYRLSPRQKEQNIWERIVPVGSVEDLPEEHHQMVPVLDDEEEQQGLTFDTENDISLIHSRFKLHRIHQDTLLFLSDSADDGSMGTSSEKNSEAPALLSPPLVAADFLGSDVLPLLSSGDTIGPSSSAVLHCDNLFERVYPKQLGGSARKLGGSDDLVEDSESCPISWRFGSVGSKNIDRELTNNFFDSLSSFRRNSRQLAEFCIELEEKRLSINHEGLFGDSESNDLSLRETDMVSDLTSGWNPKDDPVLASSFCQSRFRRSLSTSTDSAFCQSKSCRTYAKLNSRLESDLIQKCSDWGSDFSTSGCNMTIDSRGSVGSMFISVNSNGVVSESVRPPTKQNRCQRSLEPHSDPNQRNKISNNYGKEHLYCVSHDKYSIDCLRIANTYYDSLLEFSSRTAHIRAWEAFVKSVSTIELEPRGPCAGLFDAIRDPMPLTVQMIYVLLEFGVVAYPAQYNSPFGCWAYPPPNLSEWCQEKLFKIIYLILNESSFNGTPTLAKKEPIPAHISSERLHTVPPSIKISNHFSAKNHEKDILNTLSGKYSAIRLDAIGLDSRFVPQLMRVNEKSYTLLVTVIMTLVISFANGESLKRIDQYHMNHSDEEMYFGGAFLHNYLSVRKWALTSILCPMFTCRNVFSLITTIALWIVILLNDHCGSFRVLSMSLSACLGATAFSVVLFPCDPIVVSETPLWGVLTCSFLLEWLEIDKLQAVVLRSTTASVDSQFLARDLTSHKYSMKRRIILFFIFLLSTIIIYVVRADEKEAGNSVAGMLGGFFGALGAASLTAKRFKWDALYPIYAPKPLQLRNFHHKRTVSYMVKVVVSNIKQQARYNLGTSCITIMLRIWGILTIGIIFPIVLYLNPAAVSESNGLRCCCCNIDHHLFIHNIQGINDNRSSYSYPSGGHNRCGIY